MFETVLGLGAKSCQDALRGIWRNAVSNFKDAAADERECPVIVRQPVAPVDPKFDRWQPLYADEPTAGFNDVLEH